MSENRSLSVLEILVHLSASIPDRHVLGSAEIPDDVIFSLPRRWAALPMYNAFRIEADLSGFSAIQPKIDINERRATQESMGMNPDEVDQAPEPAPPHYHYDPHELEYEWCPGWPSFSLLPQLQPAKPHPSTTNFAAAFWLSSEIQPKRANLWSALLNSSHRTPESGPR
jgi:hypothetical protein